MRAGDKGARRLGEGGRKGEGGEERAERGRGQEGRGKEGRGGGKRES